MNASSNTYNTCQFLYNRVRGMHNKPLVTIRQALSIALLVIFMIGFATTASAQSTDADDYAKIYELILDEQWEEANDEIGLFIKKEEYQQSPWRDDVWYWHCFSSEKRGGKMLEHSYDCYSGFPGVYPRSPWVDDAKSGLIRVARLLAKDGNPEYEAVVESMKESDDEEVALSALYALQNIGDEKALKTIVGLYERSDSERLRGKIVYILGNFDTPEVITMLSDIATSNESTRIRKNAVNALGNRDEPEAREALKEVITSDSKVNGIVEVQKSALYALGNTESSDVLAFLREVALTSDREELGKAATYSISNTDNREAAEALKDILQNGPSTAVRKAALHSLGNLDDASSLSILLEVAKDNSNRELQKAAVHSISNLDDSYDELVDIFKSVSSEEVRRTALYALGNLDDGRVNAFLLDIALNYEDQDLAKNAVYALSNLDNSDGTLQELLRTSKRIEVKKAVLYQLSENVDVLISVLENETSAELRKTAVYALGNADDEENEVVPILLDFAKNDADLSVRKAAINALGNMGTDYAQEALIEILEQN